jgi:hypothetical protein
MLIRERIYDFYLAHIFKAPTLGTDFSYDSTGWLQISETVLSAGQTEYSVENVPLQA